MSSVHPKCPALGETTCKIWRRTGVIIIPTVGQGPSRVHYHSKRPHRTPHITRIPVHSTLSPSICWSPSPCANGSNAFTPGANEAIRQHAVIVATKVHRLKLEGRATLCPAPLPTAASFEPTAAVVVVTAATACVVGAAQLIPAMAATMVVALRLAPNAAVAVHEVMAPVLAPWTSHPSALPSLGKEFPAPLRRTISSGWQALLATIILIRASSKARYEAFRSESCPHAMLHV